MEDVTVVAGKDKIDELRRIAQLHYWRHTANMTKHGFRPRAGWTIKRFNADHQRQARRWTEVYTMATELIKADRPNWEG